MDEIPCLREFLWLAVLMVAWVGILLGCATLFALWLFA